MLSAAVSFRKHVPLTQGADFPGASHGIRRDRFRDYLAAVAGTPGPV
ncbi:MAG: hypothetical protein KC442_22805 [Thermomicrobiales bacterium]|nr:hypothetical protein [Thermomicrobiales bacterium]MCA9880652.1 hypothetical protein [Thermomicrobiales bacterium]